MKTILFLVFLISTTTTMQAQKTLYDFGVKGDGTDETKLIQAAINASAGKTLIVPNDTFNVITIAGVSNLKLIGLPGAYIQLRNFYNEKLQNLIVENIIFNGNMVRSKTYTMFQIIDCKNVTVTNNTFKNNMGEGIAAKGSSNIKILNNKIVNTDCGFFGVGGNDKIEVAYNFIEGGTSDGVVFWGFSKSLIDSNCTAHHNRVINKPQGSGTLIRYSKNITAYENYAENCSIGFGHDEKADYSPSNIIVKENTYSKCRVGINMAVNNSKVLANRIDSTKEHAILIGSPINKTHTFNNIVQGDILVNVLMGLRFINAKNCVADNITVIDTREAKKTMDAVQVMWSENIKVTNCNGLGASTPFFINESTNTFLHNNTGRIEEYKSTGTMLIGNK